MKKVLLPALVFLALFHPFHAAGFGPDRIRNDAAAFLTLCQWVADRPLTGREESSVLEKVTNAMSTLPPEDLRTFDTYPGLLRAVMKSRGDEAKKLRATAKSTIRDSLKRSPSVKSAVDSSSLVKGKKGGVVILEGDPPLNLSAATSFSEMFVYSTMLRENPGAKPEEIPAEGVASVRTELMTFWDRMNQGARKRIASVPRVWAADRAVLRFGSKEASAGVRKTILELTNPPVPPQGRPAGGMGAPSGAQAGSVSADKKSSVKWPTTCDEFLGEVGLICSPEDREWYEKVKKGGKEAEEATAKKEGWSQLNSYMFNLTNRMHSNMMTGRSLYAPRPDLPH